MTRLGYYRYATIAGDTIAFVCEDDLWSFRRGDRAARRVTAGMGEVSFPRLSPDGTQIAFVSRDEGHPEVALIDADGGPVRRLTHLGGESCLVSGWRTDGSAVVFVNDAHAAFGRDTTAYTVAREGGSPVNLHLGHVRSLHFAGAGGEAVLGRNADDPARWKRYRGGTAGDLWIDRSGSGEFERLLTLKGNLVAPQWIGERIYFLSDHEGIGNIYSCTPDGDDVRRHTHEQEYFARFPHSDGKQLVYTSAGAIKVLDLARDTVEALEIATPSSAPQTARRFVPGAAWIEAIAPSPSGERLAVTARGRSFTMALWEEAAVHFAGGGGTRSRLAAWLHDGKRIAYVTDAGGFERIELRDGELGEPEAVTTQALGRFNELCASPVDDLLAFATHRHELGVIRPGDAQARILDVSEAARLYDLAFSPDGRWIAYAISAAKPPAVPNSDCSLIRIVEIATGEKHDVTDLLRADRSPAWDPEGRFLAFLSNRDFHPVYDALQFDLSFPQATRPYLVTLRPDVVSPFRPKVAPVYSADDKDDAEDAGSGDDKSSDDTANAEKTAENERPPVKPVDIDFEGIRGRIIGFPVEEGDYGQIVAAKGRVIFTRFPLKGIDPHPKAWDEESREGIVQAYEFSGRRSAILAEDISELVLGPDGRTLVLIGEDRIRVIDAGGELPDEPQAPPEDESPSRKNGIIDLGRLAIEVDPAAEWSQIYHEAWRLQQEHFWDASMSKVDWQRVRDRYARLLPLLRTRAELSDLIWEMQGELGTSHAYEIGGDYRRPSQYRRGFLGADFGPATDAGVVVERILRGDSWIDGGDSPLAAPGVDIKPGDRIVAVGDQRLGRGRSLDEALVHAAGREVRLTVARDDAQFAVTIATLRDERALRYRAWVEGNRALVHERTGGRVGYVHIPDMGPWGFAEFHRGFLSEFSRAGLIVDARHNRGGHISPLILEKLARKRVGYDVPRYGPPMPYPPESVAGPIVALTDQFAGSDGDIFSHCFKLYKLGPLVGKRTWGGVIGINPSHELIDGTVTTQPEFSFWFTDVGWSVENYGTDPDYDVDLAPQDVHAGRDPQMDKALELMAKALETAPATPPEFTPRPDLSLP